MTALQRSGAGRLPFSSTSSISLSTCPSNASRTTTSASSLTRVSSTNSPLASLSLSSSSSSSRLGGNTQQRRPATLLRRPRRPYTFTQLVRLSDGSVYQHRTTSPVPVYTSQRDARNTLLWNPSSAALAGVESDEAGRLAAFRARFGRGWDARDGSSEAVEAEGEALEEGFRREQEQEQEPQGREFAEEDDGGDLEGGLMDLISEYSTQDSNAGQPPPMPPPRAAPKGKKGGKK